MGQWEDEVHKHAPGLTVMRHHSTNKINATDIADADVVVTTATFQWAKRFLRRFEFHRVVLDESHLLGTSSMHLKHTLEFDTKRKVCVTATPFTSSLIDLDRQSRFLNLNEDWRRLGGKEFLKRFMTRHVKEQMIDGVPALQLPESTSVVKILPMTDWERHTFGFQLRGDPYRHTVNMMNGGCGSVKLSTGMLTSYSPSCVRTRRKLNNSRWIYRHC